MTPSMKALIDHLRATPAGCTKQDLVAVLPIGFLQVQKLVGMLTTSSVITYVREGGAGKDNHTRRYYAHEHAPKVGTQKMVNESVRRTKQRTAAPIKPFSGEARITSDTKVTICPPFVDRRWHVETPARVVDAQDCREWARSAA